MEPDQPIEKLLKASARKRREQAGAPFRLHPAERRLLQGEVSRTFGAEQKKSAGSSFAKSLEGRFWPRFAWTFGVLTGVAAAALLMWPAPQSSDTQLAYLKDSTRGASVFKTERPDSSAGDQITANRTAPVLRSPGMQNKPDVSSTLDDAAVPAASVSANNGSIAPPSIAKGFASSRREEDAKTRSAEMPAFGGAASGPVGSAASVDRNYRLKKDLEATTETVSGERQVAAKPQASGSTASSDLALGQGPTRALGVETDGLGRDKKLSTQSAAPSEAKEKTPQPDSFHFYSKAGFGPPVAERQRFTQSRPLIGLVGGKSADMSTVLRTFEVQHTGDEVKIVDDDGSIYSGGLLPRSELQPAPALVRRKPSAKALESGAAQQKNSPADANARTATAVYSFKASGTNRTLNENVILNGEIIFLGETNAGSLGGLGGAAGGSNSPALSLPLKNSKVSGDAQVGERAFRFDAEPIK